MSNGYKRSWVDLHHHSEYSLLDGFGSITEHVRRAKELGHPAVAFTEHGTARGFFEVDKVCQAEGVRPIFGIEFYVAKNCRVHNLTPEQIAAVTNGLKGKEKTAAKTQLERALGITEARHCVVIALNDEGVKNLIKLNNLANTVGLRVSRGKPKPRIDLDLLCQYNEGLAVSTACLGGIAAIPFMDDDENRLYDDLEQLRRTFGRERLSLEIQPHDIREQRAWNLRAVELSDELDIPLLAANDSHYVYRQDWRTHDALITMRFGRKLKDESRIRYIERSFAIKSVAGIEDAFDRYHPKLFERTIDAAIERAADIGDRARGGLWKPKTILLPEITKRDPDTVLESKCLSGWKFRDIKARARRAGLTENDYLDRLSHELGVIEELGFARYFLIVYDMIAWARSQGIVIGPGRGSAAGSVVCFLLGITALDPLEYGLLFERFLTPGRPDWPDIDVDVERDRRKEVLQYLRGKYEHTVQIGTVIRMRGRMAFKDVARVHGIKRKVADEMANAIVGAVVRDGEDGSVAETLKTSTALQEFEARHPDVIHHTLELEGHIRGTSVHPAGVVCSPIPFDDFVPLEARVLKGKVVLVTAYDMHAVEKIGLIKVDVLGLKTLSAIGTCLRFVQDRRGIELDLEALTLDCPDVLQAFTDQDFACVFQYDTPSAYKATKGVVFDLFDDIAATNAINRPGPAQSGLADEWRKRKRDVRKRVRQHKDIDRICSDSYGVIIYQEHIIRILQAFGFNPKEAGALRKLIGKSKGIEAIEQHRDQFVDGAVLAGMQGIEAERLWTQIAKFGKYGFNKCVTPDTLLDRAYGGPISIGEAYATWNTSPPTSLSRKMKAGRWRVLQMQDDGRIRPGFVRGIHFNGKRDVFKVTTATGKTIRATGNHRLLTDSGYREVSTMRTGDLLVSMAPRPPVYVCKGRKQGRGVSHNKPEGFPTGKGNPAWVDGRKGFLDDAKHAVQIRSHGQCEECSFNGSSRFEFAHTKSLEQCDGDYEKYHSEGNLRHLCNSCHKLFDYAKGERKPAWSKGRATQTEAIVSIEPDGTEDVYDVEMATHEHNFVANGIISHNSHAAAYGQIAYWCQYLKLKFPLEFFGAFLAVEHDVEKANRIVREAARRGVTIEPPEINRSQAAWSVESGSLLTGLRSVKGVGENACREILSQAPFTDIVDLFARINRRVVHKGVIEALVKAGALRSLWPNTRHAIENLPELMKRLKGKNGLELATELIEEGDTSPRYDKEEEWALQIGVGVAGSGRHPIGVLDSMSEVLRQDWGNMAELLDGDIVRGVVSNHRVGTSDGRRWASVELEDENGNTCRIKLDDDGYAEWRDIVSLGDGAILAARVRVRRGHCYPEYFVDMLGLRRRHREGEDIETWSTWERCVLGSDDHILSDYERPWNGLAWRSGKVCLVTNVKVIRDRNQRHMAFVRIEGLSGLSREGVVFANQWEVMDIEQGDIVRVIGTLDEARGSLVIRATKTAKQLA